MKKLGSSKYSSSLDVVLETGCYLVFREKKLLVSSDDFGRDLTGKLLIFLADFFVMKPFFTFQVSKT